MKDRACVCVAGMSVRRRREAREDFFGSWVEPPDECVSHTERAKGEAVKDILFVFD